MFDYASKIQRLLATAESLEGTNPEAAANYRAKAETLMREYRIAEEEALASDAAAASPIKHTILLVPNRRGGGISMAWYTSIFRRIADHCGIRFVTDYPAPDYNLVAVVVGYEGDIRYAEFLYTAAYLMFATRIDPVWDNTLPEVENIWRMRNAGIERRKIADKAWGNGHEAKARTKVQRVYLKECALRGEPVRAAGLSHQTSVYREAYAQSFVDTLDYRLRMAREATDVVGGGLVLHGRADRVEEAFYGFFPSLRPVKVSTQGVAEPVTTEPCTNCAKAKSGHCREHRPLTWTKADERRWQARHYSPSAQAGQASGRAAAEGVILRGTQRSARLDASGRAIEG